MFLKYRIMKKLKFDEPLSVREVCDLFPRTPDEKVCIAIDWLGCEGFLVANSEHKISPKVFTSFYRYKVVLRKAFLEFCVSIAAIIVGITSILELLQ